MPFETSKPTPDCLVVVAHGLLTQADYHRGLVFAREHAKAGLRSLVISAERVNAEGVSFDASVLDAFETTWAELQRIALVGDVGKYLVAIRTFGLPTEATFKRFERGELDVAVSWACSGDLD